MNWKWFGVIVPVAFIIVLIIFAAFPIGITVEKRTVGSVPYDAVFSSCSKKTTLQVITVKNSFFLEKIVSLPIYDACPFPYEQLVKNASRYRSEYNLDLQVKIFSHNRYVNSLTVSAGKDNVVQVAIIGTCELNKEYEFDEILLFEENVDCSKLTDSQKSSAMRIKVVR